MSKPTGSNRPAKRRRRQTEIERVPPWAASRRLVANRTGDGAPETLPGPAGLSRTAGGFPAPTVPPLPAGFKSAIPAGGQSGLLANFSPPRHPIAAPGSTSARPRGTPTFRDRWLSAAGGSGAATSTSPSQLGRGARGAQSASDVRPENRLSARCLASSLIKRLLLCSLLSYFDALCKPNLA